MKTSIARCAVSWLPLVGHDRPLEQLRRAASRGRLGHAFLFVGPSGIGKRRLARHVAQGLLCETRPAPALDPCGECAGCRQVEADSHPDFTEAGKPEDKNQFPIELMHDLCARVSLKPARGKYKILVIDDADSFNEESANCFLKTLEEPPPGSIIILLATSVETQLPTVVSRCQTIRFHELSEDEAAGVLIKLGFAPDMTEATKLARLADGSVGLAAELAGDDWQRMRRRIVDGLGGLPDGNVALASSIAEFVEEAGKEAAAKRARVRRLVRLAVGFYRDCLSAKETGRQPGDSDQDAISTTVARLDSDAIVDLIERCLDADYHIARFLNQTLAVDCWIDDLAQIASGKYVPSAAASGSLQP